MRDESEIFNEFYRLASDAAGIRFHAEYFHYGHACESPIERVLLGAMLLRLTASPMVWAHFHRSGVDWRAILPADEIGAHIYPQSIVGPYRVDFLFRLVGPDTTTLLVVECDGHEFHERTKEQAARDRGRDRWMAANNIRVLRFTGSEIWRNPHKCADEIVEHVFGIFGDSILGHL